MEVKLVLKNDIVVVNRINFDNKNDLTIYMQGFITCFSRFRKKKIALYAYDYITNEFIDAVYN